MKHLSLRERIVRSLGYPPVADLSEERQAGLRAFWLDGMFAATASGFADPYYSLYMLSLSASASQIGLVNTLNQLITAIVAMPGAAIADRTGRYKQMALFAGLVSRLMWPIMIAAPLLGDQAAVWVIIAAWVGIAGMGALGNAAWTALSADLVPARLRGAYFASRNIIMQLVGLAAIPLAGQLISWIGEPQGYQINLVFAFAFDAVSLHFYRKLPEHTSGGPPDRLSMREVVRRIRQMPTFARFTAAHTILMLGVMMGGPFINVYMVEDAEFSVGTIGLVTTVGVLASLLAMRIMGRLHDRFGIIWTMRFGLGVPLIPVAWLWVTQPWQAYVISGLSALTWSGYNLGAFNLVLAATPDEHRPRYVAFYTLVVSLVGAIGPAVGGWLLDATGFMPVFSLSTIIRSLGMIYFFALVHEPEPASSGAAPGTTAA